MTRRMVFPAFLCLLVAATPPLSAGAAPGERIQLTLDTSEAEQVLAILSLRQEGKPVGDVQWQKLFATAPYQRLKQREKEIGEKFHDTSRAFTDDDFRKFVLSDDLRARAAGLRETLERWKRADLRRSAQGVLAYLPDGAVIHAKVYPVIKPQSNSFVWEISTDPTIFLYIDPEVTREKFQNTVAHELHHIGLGSLGDVYESRIASLAEKPRAAAEWMGSFGEGMAMLAAAGGPDVDPHAESTPKEHAKWDKEISGFDADLMAVDAFLLDLLGGKLDKDAAEAKGSSFFGSHQGPWYTVGYRMAVLVEKRYGRPALIRTMLDYRCLLFLYNRAAAERNASGKERLPLWSESLLSQVQAAACGDSAVPKS